jgi:PAS domain S-box-containing protein
MTHLLLNVDARDHERAEKSRLLEQAGYAVIEAGTEADALRLVLDRQPAVVIVNTRLPQIDGYRLGRQIKSHPDAAGSFVLLLAPAFEGPTPPLSQIADAFLPAPPYYPALLAQIRLLTRLWDSMVDRHRVARAVVRQAAQHALLREVTDLVLQNATPEDELVPLIFRRAEGLVETDVGLYHRAEDDSGPLVLRSEHGLSDVARRAGERVAVGTGFAGTVAATKTPLVATEDLIQSDPRGALLRGFGVRAYACQPLLRSDGRVLGTLAFGSTRRASFEPDELDFLRTLGHLVALVAERATADRALRESESTLQSFSDSSPYVMGIAETDGNSVVTVYRNAAAARSADVPANHRDLWIAQVEESVRTGRPVRFQYRSETHDGLRWLEATVTAVPAADPAKTRFHFIVEDVTERVVRDDALKSSEERLRVALAATRLGTWEWTAATDELICDARAAELYDLPAGGGVTWEWMLQHRVHPDDRPDALARLAVAASGDGWYRSIHRVVSGAGAIRWVEASAQMLFDRETAPRTLVRLVGTTADVTLIKQAEQALIERQERLRELVEALPLLAWTCEPSGACDYVSPQWVDYTGIDAALQLGTGWLEQVHPADHERVRAAWADAVGAGAPLAVEFRIRRYDGEYCWFDTRAVPIDGRDGRIAKWLGISMNVNDRKRAEQALRDADRRKDEFLAMLSHELRNPLAPIRNSVSLLRQSGLRDPIADHARDVIDRQVTHLTRLVDDLLDVSRITQGKVRLARERISLASALERAVEANRPHFESRHVGLTFSVSPDPVEVEADLTRIVQSVGNLLHNAAKFSPEGSTVVLSAGVEGDDAVIRVRDEGMGIAPELLPHVFDLFTQGDHALDRPQGGLGIGLTIVRAVVELHGGEVAVTSPGMNQGSEFTIRLPVAAPTGPATSQLNGGEHPNRGGYRVLVVDDNKDGAESLRLLLELQGYDVRVAADGPTALEIAIGFEPATVVLDIGLPGMDGYHVAEILRSEPATSRALLIAVTGYGRDQDKARATAAGFDVHLVKPVDPDDLQTLIAEHRDRETAAI